MRTPFRTIKGNHTQGGGVPQEEYDELLERYNEAIEWKMLAEIFTPQQLIIENAIRNTQWNFGYEKDIADGIANDWQFYYHYFWFENSVDSDDKWQIWIFKKQKWTNPVFVTWPTITEAQYNDSVDLGVKVRMKIDEDGVKASSLSFKQRTVNNTKTLYLYSINIVNDVATTATIYSWWWDTNIWYSYTDIPNRDELRTASCWISESESISPAWFTTITTPRGSSSSYKNVVATLT